MKKELPVEREKVKCEVQIRHKQFGVFQAHIVEIGLLFYPQSEMPEFGIHKFRSLNDAQDAIAYFTSVGLKRRDFSIEAWNSQLDEHLHQLSKSIAIAEKGAQQCGIYGTA